MKKYIALFLAAVAILCQADISYAKTSQTIINGGSSNKVIASTRNVNKSVSVTPFNKISVSNGIKVCYTQSRKTAVSLYAPNNVVNYVVVKVSGKKLDIRYKKGVTIDYGKNTQAPVVYVLAPDVYDFEAESGSVIEISDDLNCNNKIELEASSGAKITTKDLTAINVSIESESGALVNVAEVNCTKFELETESGSQTSVKSVKATTADIEASSGSQANVKKAVCGTVKTDASSGSKISVAGINAQNVDAKSSSASDIMLSGKAGFANFNATSVSTISAKNLKVSNGTVKTSSQSKINCNIDKVTSSRNTSGQVTNNGKNM
jgi:hypothetical protein